MQLAPESTGGKIRTRERTINANTVDEQYVLLGKPQVVTSRVWVSTYRVRTRAVAVSGTVSQWLFTVWNGGANQVSVRRLSVEADSAALRPSANCHFRTYRLGTTAPANGNLVTPVQQDTADAALSAAVVVRADSTLNADTGTMPTALTATPLPTTPAWHQVMPKLATSANYVQSPALSLIPNDSRLNAEDPFIMRPSEGVGVRLEGAAGGVAWAADDWTFQFKAVLGEFTIP